MRYATFRYASRSANLRSHFSQDGCFSFITRCASKDLWEENHMSHRPQYVGCMFDAEYTSAEMSVGRKGDGEGAGGEEGPGFERARSRLHTFLYSNLDVGQPTL